MIGKLDPEERVMEDSVMYPGGMLGQLAIALEKMGWDSEDNIAVEILEPLSMKLMVLELNGHPKRALVSIIKMLSL